MIQCPFGGARDAVLISNLTLPHDETDLLRLRRVIILAISIMEGLWVFIGDADLRCRSDMLAPVISP